MKNKLMYLLIVVILVLTVQQIIAQTGTTGKITQYPESILTGEWYDIIAETNADKVVFKIILNGNEIWDRTEFVSNGIAQKRLYLSSRTSPGEAQLLLIDKDSENILDQRKVVIVDPKASNNNNNQNSPTNNSNPVIPKTDKKFFGIISEYPSYVIPGKDFKISANTNVERVRIEIYRGSDRLWWKTERVKNNKVELIDDVSSRTKLGNAVLYLKDYNTKEVLDQKTISIVDKIPENTNENQNGDNTNKNQDTPQQPVFKPILFSFPDFPDNGKVMEGDWIKTSISQGVPYSQFSIEVLYDGNIVYQHSFSETDGNGNSFVQFQMPYKLLKPGHDVDGLIIRLTHGGVEINKPFTLIKGLEIIVPSEIKEGEEFTYEVKNSAGNTAVKAGITYDTGPDHEFGMKETDGSGYARIKETIPNLIKNGADRDGAEFWVETKDVKWYFQITLVKADKPIENIEKKAEVKGIKTTSGKQVYPLSEISTTNKFSDISVNVISTSLNIDDILHAEGERLAMQIQKPSFQYITGESKILDSNLHKFHVSYSGIASSTGYLQLRRVIANVYYPPGFLNTMCTETEVYSSGRLIKKVTNSCKSFHSASIIANSVSVVALYIPLDEIGPIVKKEDSEIVVTIRYLYVGPYGEDSTEGHEDITANTPKWIGILRDTIFCDVDPTNPLFIGDPCSQPPKDLVGVIEKTNNRLSGKVRIVVPIP